MRHRAAYYSRSDSYSRSYNASAAEAEGRLPRTRAAAELRVSVAAFDAGCDAAGYSSREWHHVGKYANQVDYYDVEELRLSPDFWHGAAQKYKGAAKRAALMAASEAAKVAAALTEIVERKRFVEAFRSKLVRQRDCSHEVRRHDSEHAWRMRCDAVRAAVEFCNVPGIIAATKAWKAKTAAAAATTVELFEILRTHFVLVADKTYEGLGVRVMVHQNKCVNVYGLKKSMNIGHSAAVEMLKELIDPRA